MSVDRKVKVESRSALMYLGPDRQPVEGLERRVESLDVADLQDGARRVGQGGELLGLGERAGHRLLDEGGDPPLQEGAGDLAVQDRRHGDHGGIHRGEEPAVVGQSRRLATGGHGSGPLGAGVGHADEAHARHRREDAGVMLAQVPDPDDADSQRLHAWTFLQRSRARPCLPRCWASMNSSRFFTSGQT